MYTLLRVLLATLALTHASAAAACSCGNATLSQHAEGAEVIVEGSVAWAGPREQRDREEVQRLRLSVVHTFKGHREQFRDVVYLHCNTRTINADPESSTIWFLYESEGELSAHLCGGHASANEEGRAAVKAALTMTTRRVAARRALARKSSTAKGIVDSLSLGLTIARNDVDRLGDIKSTQWLSVDSVLGVPVENGELLRPGFLETEPYVLNLIGRDSQAAKLVHWSYLVSLSNLLPTEVSTDWPPRVDIDAASNALVQGDPKRAAALRGLGERPVNRVARMSTLLGDACVVLTNNVRSCRRALESSAID